MTKFKAFMTVVQVRGDVVVLMIPNWSRTKKVEILRNAFPDRFQSLIKPGKTFLARVNLKATSAEDLNIRNFEEAPM